MSTWAAPLALLIGGLLLFAIASEVEIDQDTVVGLATAAAAFFVAGLIWDAVVG